MTQPGITRLARRLAEENNVDWRSLHGSGDDGEIVEMDVLDYLARVMAGEEAVDPTPEPLPEGLEAWPDGDRFGTGEAPEPAGNGDAAAAGGTAPADTGGAAADADDFELSEDMFLFGEETVPDLEHDAGEPEADLSALGGLDGDAAARDGDSPADADDWLFGEENLLDSGLFQAYPEPGPEDDSPGDWDLPEEETDGPEQEPALADADPPLADEAVFGPDDKLDDSEFSRDDLFDLAFEDGELDEPWLADDDLRDFELGAVDESLEEQAERVTGVPPEEGGPAADTPPEPAAPLDTAEAEASEAEAADPEWDDSDGDEALLLAERIEAAFQSVADEPPEFETFDESLETEPTAAEAEAVPAAAVPAPLPAAVAGTGQAETTAFPGHVLRRTVDTAAFGAACELAAADVGDDTAAVPTAFLLLAARRAAAATGFRQDAGTAAAVLLSGAEPEYFTGFTGGESLRELVPALRPGTGSDAGAAAAAAFVAGDLGSLDADELLLPLPVPVLMLGRSSAPGNGGAPAALLSLSGSFDLNTGAAFLSELADLLAEPLRILL